MSIQRVNPVRGTETERAWVETYAADIMGAGELHTTTQDRLFLQHKIIGGGIDHGTFETLPALESWYLQPSCTRGVWPGDTAYVTAAGCEYRCTNRTGVVPVWRRSTAAMDADPAGTAAGLVAAEASARAEADSTLATAIAGKQPALTISTVGSALLAVPTPSAAMIPRINADATVTLIDVPSGGGGGSWLSGATSAVSRGTPVTVSSATLTMVCNSTTETIIPDTTVAAGNGATDKVDLSGNVHLSHDRGGVSKNSTVRLRRGGLTGEILWTGTTGDVGDSTGGDQFTLLFSAVDATPGAANQTYVLTQQPNVNTTYSASRAITATPFSGDSLSITFSAGAENNVTISCPGATSGDAVVIGYGGTATLPVGLICKQAYAVADGVVVVFHNLTSAAIAWPATVSVTCDVFPRP